MVCNVQSTVCLSLTLGRLAQDINKYAEINYAVVIVAGYPGNYSNYQQNFYNSVNQGLQKVLGSQVYYTLTVYCSIPQSTHTLLFMHL